MKSRNIKILISFLIICLLITSCSSKNKDNEKVEKEIEEQMLEENKEKIIEEFKTLTNNGEKDLGKIMAFIDKNINNVKKEDADMMILKLEEISIDKSVEIKNEIMNLDKNKELKTIIGEDVLLSENRISEIKNKELKKYLEDILKKPFKIACYGQEKLNILIDYDQILKYSSNVSENLEEYLSLMANEINNPIIFDDSIIVSYEDIEKRLLNLEHFLTSSENLIKYEEILNKYRDNMIIYLKGTEKTPIYDKDTLKVKEDVFKSYVNISKNKEDVTPHVIRKYVNMFENNDKKVLEDNDMNILSIVNESLNNIEEHKNSLN